MSAVVLWFAIGSLTAPAAYAYVPTPAQRDAIVQWLSRGGVPSGADLPCGTVCDDLWLSEHRPIPNQVSSQSLYRELFQARQKMGLLPGWEAIGRASLVVGAGAVGWEIGTGLRHTWLGFGTVGRFAPANYPPITTWSFKPAGDPVVLASPFAPDIPMPWDGFAAESDNGVWGGHFYLHATGTFPDCTPGQDPVPVAGGGWQTFYSDSWTSEVACGTEEREGFGAAVPMVAPGTYGGVPFGSYSRTFGSEATDPAVSEQAAPVNGWDGQIPDWATGDSFDQRIAPHWQDYPVLNAWLGHEFDPVNNPDPIAEVKALPSCIGLSYNACLTALQAAGFGAIETQTRDFAHAVPLPQAQAQQVLAQNPAAGSQVSTAATVLLDVNPDDDAMPRLVPTFGPRETHQGYETKLTGLGLTLDPLINDQEHGDPLRGPDEVTTTNPAPGTRVPKGDPVTTRINPPDWPDPAGFGGGCDPANVRPFDLTPLQVGLGNAFPFGVFGWIGATLGDWVQTPVAPVFHLKINERIDWNVDMAVFEPAMAYARPAMLIVSMLGVVWMLAASAMRLSQPPDD